MTRLLFKYKFPHQLSNISDIVEYFSISQFPVKIFLSCPTTQSYIFVERTLNFLSFSCYRHLIYEFCNAKGFCQNNLSTKINFGLFLALMLPISTQNIFNVDRSIFTLNTFIDLFLEGPKEIALISWY